MDSRDDRTRRVSGSGGSAEGTGNGAAGKAEQDKSLRSQVSVPQVSGAALASVTAAFLGSQLGVAGTVAGAGMTSVIITVGGVLYQRSLEKTKEKAVLAAAKAAERAKVVERAKAVDERVADERLPGERAARTRALGTSAAEGRTRRHPTTGEEPAATRRIQVGSGMHWPGGELVDGPASNGPAPEATTRVVRAEPQTRAVQLAPAFKRKRRTGALVAVGSCAAAFVVAMVVVTGFEGVTGKPLSGGDRGTTVGQVFGPPAEPVDPQPEPVPETTAEPTTSPETSSAEQPGTTAPSSEQQPSGGTSGDSGTPGTGTQQPQPTGDQPTGGRPTGSSSSVRPTGQQEQPAQQQYDDGVESGSTAG